MKLYAIRNIYTGEFHRDYKDNRIKTYEDEGLAYAEIAFITDYDPIYDYEVVTFREIPDKPCEWCDVWRRAGSIAFPNDKQLPPAEMMFCSICGRRLRDDLDS